MTEANPYAPSDSLYKDPETVGTEGKQQDPSGLGGWLILVGIGLVVSPLRLGVFIVQILVPVFTDGAWEILTTPGSEHYHALWAPLLIFELLGNLGFIGAYIVLAILFFRKSRFFPMAYIAIAFMNLCFIILDAFLSSFVLPGEPMFDPETTKQIARALGSLAIWGPYMLVSKRVKNTFV
jgi:hypothetical protein